ncbi:hypothetical protein LTR36_003989 [Oleoguttula mirabilis]|uniref:Uncharacterized protein n=1 Tax=Oleoguttula mirabilis TaxID=1507867 RepID=A0AAV9JH77_9PEZI|nr:hypothetical protein LTR36_003989 [Oleoguttula mirabilis]
MKRRFKATISLLFALRIFCPVFSALHAVSISEVASHSNLSLASAGPLVWQSVGVGYALFTSLILALKTFLRSFHMGMGMDMPYTAHPYGKDGSRDPSYPLESRTQNSNVKRPSVALQWRNHRCVRAEQDGEYRPEQLKYSATVVHEDGRDMSIKSGSSSRPIIRRDVQYTVSHEDGSGEDAGSDTIAS